jgi:hypothetical protein
MCRGFIMDYLEALLELASSIFGHPAEGRHTTAHILHTGVCTYIRELDSVLSAGETHGARLSIIDVG